jgi:CheY-like chemotaxis protein
MAEYKVLLVDNNTIRRKLLAGYLTQLQCLYSEAKNGKQAIEMITNDSFDLVLMDIQLPVIDGIEATKIIRKKLPFPKNRVKIIANTTTNYKDFFNQFYDVGFNDVLPTPNTLDSLKTIIEYHIRD